MHRRKTYADEFWMNSEIRMLSLKHHEYMQNIDMPEMHVKDKMLW